MRGNLKELIAYYKQLSIDIEETLLDGHLEEAIILIEKYNSEIDDAKVYAQKAIFHFQKGEYNDAAEILENGLNKHPFNYALNYNLGFILAELGKLSEAIKFFLYAVKYSNSNEEQESATEQINKILSKSEKNKLINQKNILNDYNTYKRVLQELDGRFYPLGKDGESKIRKVIKKGDKEEFFINMYKSLSIQDVDGTSRMYFKSELIKGKEVVNRAVFELEYPAIIPISLISPQTEITVSINGEKIKFQKNDLSHQKVHYIKVSNPGKVVIKSTKNIFVGNPILDNKEKLSKKLVMKIFIDGLSMKFLEEQGLQSLMPNTYQFFENGLISSNCYGTSEWTLPCKASINTGKYATNHKLLHPTFNYSFENSNKLMAEYFNEAGYFTTKICTNWRTTPFFGYYKGFDRIVYQNFLGGMGCGEVVMEAVEHLESFAFKNNFLSLSIMDLHNVPDEIENHLMAEVNTDIKYREDTNNKGITSVQTRYDESKIYKYGLEIKRVDVYLGILFDYLLKKYKEEEMLVVLHSDHGQSFLENDENILHDSRIKIPLMVKGQGIINESQDELIEMIDILPLMMNMSGLIPPTNIDGKLPKTFGGEVEREYSITQIIHPDQPYKAVIKDSKYKFYFETKEHVKKDLTINIDEYQSRLFDKSSNEDMSQFNKDILEKYELLIFNQIKDFIRWDN